MCFPSKRKRATTENRSTDTIRCVLNSVGLWPSTRNLYSSPNYFQHSIFSTALLPSIVSPDNGFDLITDRDEFASHKVRPGIILPPAFRFCCWRKVGELWSLEKLSFRAGGLKTFVKIPIVFAHISGVMCSFPLWVLSLWHRVYCSAGSFNIHYWANDLHTSNTYKCGRQKGNIYIYVTRPSLYS